jgi:hypothetical protein
MQFKVEKEMRDFGSCVVHVMWVLTFLLCFSFVHSKNWERLKETGKIRKREEQVNKAFVPTC